MLLDYQNVLKVKHSIYLNLSIRINNCNSNKFYTTIQVFELTKCNRLIVLLDLYFIRLRVYKLRNKKTKQPDIA